MWDTDSDVVALALERRAYLERLAGGPARQRELVDELGDSRSTVHRVTGRLREAGLAEKTNGAFVATRTGELLARLVGDAERAAATMREGATLLDALPADAPLDPAFFRAARAVPASPPLESSADRAVERVGSCERLRAMVAAEYSRALSRAIHDRIRRDGARVDLLVDAAMARTATQRSPDWVRSGLDSPATTLRVRESLPYSLYVFEGADATVHLVAHGERGEYLGRFETSDPAAVHWARSVVEEYREDAHTVDAAVREPDAK